MAFFWIATHLCGKPEPPLSVLGPPFRTQRPARALCMSANSLVSLAASQTRCWNPSSWFWDLSRALFSLRLNTGRSVPLSPESACFQLTRQPLKLFIEYWSNYGVTWYFVSTSSGTKQNGVRGGRENNRCPYEFGISAMACQLMGNVCWSLDLGRVPMGNHDNLQSKCF